MAQQFKDQGGAATMDPSPLARWVSSRILTALIKRERSGKPRTIQERRRLKASLPHRVEYFHQVEDGYSHLAVQVLRRFADRYDVELICHLVEGPIGDNAPDAEKLLDLSRYESHLIAKYYGLDFPLHSQPPSSELVSKARSALVGLDQPVLPEAMLAVGHALWYGLESDLDRLLAQYGAAGQVEVNRALEQGSARQRELSHYSGAMLYYAGEWYWGIDRLYHLEARLAALGADREAGKVMIGQRPELDINSIGDTSGLRLEIYPSLRSPYTAIAFDRTVALAESIGLELNVKPVLPMVMRGVPATRQKGFYIFKDTAREADAEGQPFGPCYDPIGEPVRRCYSLYPWACSEGRGNQLLSSFLNAAFAQGINTNNDKGLRIVVESAGLDWSHASTIVGTDTGWEAMLESNRLEMYSDGLWGVPSFRLFDQNGKLALAVWGQDRLWLVARKIQELAANR